VANKSEQQPVAAVDDATARVKPTDLVEQERLFQEFLKWNGKARR
jgi:hypothetical protein